LLQAYPRVTVLVSLYQAGPYIEAKIANLLRQTKLDLAEIIFLNCQNLHNERARYDSILGTQFREVWFGSYARLYSTWNYGIRMSKSDYVVNSNVDDMWAPEFLEKCVASLDANQDAAVVSTGVSITDIPNQHSSWETSGEMPKFPYPLSTAGPCPMWRRSLHYKYGYFGDFRTIGDADMWERWLAGGERFTLIPDDLVLYYRSPVSLERRSEGGVSLRDLDLSERHELASREPKAE